MITNTSTSPKLKTFIDIRKIKGLFVNNKSSKLSESVGNLIS